MKVCAEHWSREMKVWVEPRRRIPLYILNFTPESTCASLQRFLGRETPATCLSTFCRQTASWALLFASRENLNKTNIQTVAVLFRDFLHVLSNFSRGWNFFHIRRRNNPYRGVYLSTSDDSLSTIEETILLWTRSNYFRMRLHVWRIDWQIVLSSSILTQQFAVLSDALQTVINAV